MTVEVGSAQRKVTVDGRRDERQQRRVFVDVSDEVAERQTDDLQSGVFAMRVLEALAQRTTRVDGG